MLRFAWASVALACLVANLPSRAAAQGVVAAARTVAAPEAADPLKSIRIFVPAGVHADAHHGGAMRTLGVLRERLLAGGFHLVSDAGKADVVTDLWIDIRNRSSDEARWVLDSSEGVLDEFTESVYNTCEGFSDVYDGACPSFTAGVADKFVARLKASARLREFAKTVAEKRESAAVGKPTPKGPSARDAPGLRESVIVAVFDVRDESRKSMSASSLSQLTAYLSAKVTEAGGWRVVPHDQLRARLAESKTQSYKQCFDESCQIEMGKAVAAQKSLATSILRVGNRCAISSVLFDLKTETTDRATTVRTDCGDDSLMDAVDKIVLQLSGKAPAQP